MVSHFFVGLYRCADDPCPWKTPLKCSAKMSAVSKQRSPGLVSDFQFPEPWHSERHAERLQKGIGTLRMDERLSDSKRKEWGLLDSKSNEYPSWTPFPRIQSWLAILIPNTAFPLHIQIQLWKGTHRFRVPRNRMAPLESQWLLLIILSYEKPCKETIKKPLQSSKNGFSLLYKVPY